jgi:hypothetical protein
MNLTLDLRPEIERSLLVQAQAKGLSLSAFAEEVLTQAADSTQEAENIYELFAPVRGLLADEEIDQYFARTTASSRPVDLGLAAFSSIRT